MASKILHYPVDNGDHGLISVEENGYTTHLMVDCNIRDSSAGDTKAEQFDVKADLEKILKKKTVNDVADVLFTDVFALSHGDDDHLHGFKKNFYQGDPKSYKKKNKEDGEIFIDVLWFSPMVMGESTNDDEDCFNKEAKRRIKLHRDNSADKDLAGNRIIIIGNDASESLEGLDLVRYVPGDIITRFNNRNLTTFSIFIHAPYKKQLSAAEPEKNHTSIVFQARFKMKSTDTNFATLAIFGGDADHYAWAMILEKTKKYKNDTKQQALNFDILLAPHHCSWTFFNDTPEDDHPDPVATALEMLDYANKGAFIVASSKVITAKDQNPPSKKAKDQYVKKLAGKSGTFLNTASEPSEKSPEPIVFEITANGPVRPPKGKISGAVTSAGGAGALGRSIEQG
ncbi:MAG TPA: hypothetical protein VG738_19190 [Chitinophagaceae bacterium]|nr:hypothetical protein [Chitinophagaceae bacterium]